MEAENKSKGVPMPMQFPPQPSMPQPMSSSVGSGSAIHSVDAIKGKGKASDIGQPRSVDNIFNVQGRALTKSSTAKFFYAHAIPFHVACSSYFKKMVKYIAILGPSFVPLRDHKVRSTLLDKAYCKVSLVMEDMRRTWMRTSSTVMDGWTNIKHQPLIIIVTCTVGSYFLRAIDCSRKRKEVDFQFNILREAVDEVGASNVVQVITNSACVCKLVRLIVQGAYKHIFWTYCVHALNNAMKDIEKLDWVKEVVAQARNIQMFICNHYTSLVLFMTFLKKEFHKYVETKYVS
ncbi:uncharacterized protein LOC131069351 [Cryptomeria japonica]|uniref:uncharacterized protein LOC131069351 n=1 Tax=Cryptomeria japonica TaxID=3369 RepID=UPI0027DAA90C|nr:uncharacterized protein LOC131069351 [Cryptomeria japonica]